MDLITYSGLCVCGYHIVASLCVVFEISLHFDAMTIKSLKLKLKIKLLRLNQKACEMNSATLFKNYTKPGLSVLYIDCSCMPCKKLLIIEMFTFLL